LKGELLCGAIAARNIETETRKTEHEMRNSLTIPPELVENRRRRVAALRERIRAFALGAPLTLEIGCGHGHFLADYAAAFPVRQCIGIDLLSKRIERALRKRDRAALANLDFIKADATEFLEAAGSVAGSPICFEHFFVIHPDPWPKARHHKNRLIQDAFLDTIADLAAAGAHLWFRTDSAAYHEWTREHLCRHPRWNLISDSDAGNALPWPLEPDTIFSQRLPDSHSLVAVLAP
jgi:tRNA (guanine-N7-)-methyltransferase